MTEYKSDVVKILNIATVSFSNPEKFRISVNYGVDRTFYVSKLDLTTTLTITNFTGNTPFDFANDIICEVGSFSNMVDIKTLTNPSFAVTVSSVDPTQYDITVTIDSANPDLDQIITDSTALGNLYIKFRLSDSFLTALQNDGYDVVNNIMTPDYAFLTDFGTPPKAVITSQPQNATYSGGDSTFSISFETYDGTVSVGSDWEYSDDYAGDPDLSTWVVVTGSDGSVASSILVGNEWGYGDNSNYPNVDSLSKDLTISQFQYEQNPSRYYRYRFIVT